MITPPDRQGSDAANLLEQAFGQELADELLGGAALEVRRRLDAAILAVRGAGQERKLGIDWPPASLSPGDRP